MPGASYLFKGFKLALTLCGFLNPQNKGRIFEQQNLMLGNLGKGNILDGTVYALLTGCNIRPNARDETSLLVYRIKGIRS